MIHNIKAEKELMHNPFLKLEDLRWKSLLREDSKEISNKFKLRQPINRLGVLDRARKIQRVALQLVPMMTTMKSLSSMSSVKSLDQPSPIKWVKTTQSTKTSRKVLIM
jgi:hypothetical protein